MFQEMKQILVLFAVAFVGHSQSEYETVDTAMGKVRGKVEHFLGIPVNTFLGIPFAQPPVGDQRFRKPQPVEKWSETLQATSMPPACIQYIEYPFPWNDFQDGKSEDCLYLNIWVPVTDSLKKAVMLWIFGGGYTVGSNRKKVYNGLPMAATGNVVVVTINYRLAAFGFLTSNTEEAPGNVGIYDMLEALKWVNKNIEAFGGDPNRVTIFGESAGSIAVGLLCVSPLTKGLFNRVIMESGSPAYLLADNGTQSIDLSQRLAKAVGCASDENSITDNPKQVVSCLRGVDARNLSRTLASFNPTSTRSFYPMYGDELLPVNARKALIRGDFHDVDLLIGNNKDEGSFQLATAYPDIFGLFGEKNTYINKSFGASFIRNVVSAYVSDPEAVVQHYLGNIPDDNLELIRRQVYTASGDFSLLCPDVYFAESYSKKGNDVYFYFFIHRPSKTPWAPWMGVVHYDEVAFVFGQPVLQPGDYKAQETELSSRMITIWTNFAKNGNSSGIPLYSRENPVYVNLDVGGLNLAIELGPHKENCDFFRENFGFN